MTYPVVLFWALFLWGLVSPPATSLTLLFMAMPFGSMSMVSPDLIGGVTLMPQSIFGIALMLKVLAPAIMSLSPRLRAAMSASQLGFLFSFLVTAILVTFLAPRLFEAEAVIVPMRVTHAFATELLAPIQANFTQTAYLALSVGIVFSAALLPIGREVPGQFLSAVLLGGAVAVGTGLLDQAATSSGMADRLEPFRNATYALMTNAEVQGTRRVVGLMAEASSYGGLCVGLASTLAFLRPLYPAGRPRQRATIVTLLLIWMAYQSTSSAAFGGLAVFAAVYFVQRTLRLLSPSGVTPDTMWEFAAGVGGVIVVLALVTFQPDVFTPLLNLIDELIFHKSNTGSYVERSMWNTVSLDAVWATYGLGVGLGSTRTSNWFIAIISSTGVLGASLLGAFLVQTLLRRAWPGRPQASEMATALKLSLVPHLAVMGVAGSNPDFGLLNAIVFGTITALARPAGLVPSGRRIVPLSVETRWRPGRFGRLGKRPM